MQTFIQYLIEKRSNPDKNVKQDPYSQLVKHANNADSLYASYTAIDKIGINPQSHYQTPNGIYVYHLPYMLNIMKYNNSLRAVPFASSQPHVWIIEPTTPVLIIQDYTMEQLESDKQKLIKAFSNKIPDVEKDIEVYQREAKNKMPGTAIWNITRGLSENPNKWNYILRSILGYNIVRDDGAGVIHPSEPYQGVFLSVKALKVVDKIRNNESKRDNSYTKQNADRLKHAGSIITQLCNEFLKFEKLQDFKIFIKELQRHTNQSTGFRIDKALGTKLYNKLKQTIFSYENPYYLITLATAVTTDPDLRREVGKDAQASIKFAKIIEGRFRHGEKAIAKDKKASIEYMRILEQHSYGSVILHTDSKSPEWIQICCNVLGDKNMLDEYEKKYGIATVVSINSKFKQYDIPALKEFVSKVGTDESVDSAVDTFLSSGKEEDLKHLVEICKKLQKPAYITESVFQHIIHTVLSDNSKDNYLMEQTARLLQLFSDIEIIRPLKRDLILACLNDIKDETNRFNARRVIFQLLYNDEERKQLKETLDLMYLVISQYHKQLAPAAYNTFRSFVIDLTSSDEQEAALEIIHKLQKVG